MVLPLRLLSSVLVLGLSALASAQSIAITNPPPGSQSSIPSAPIEGLIIGTPGPAPFDTIYIRTRYSDGTMCPALTSDGVLDPTGPGLGWDYEVSWDELTGIGSFAGRAKWFDPGVNYVDLYYPGSTLGTPDHSLSLVFQPAGLQPHDAVAIVHPIQRTVDVVDPVGNPGEIAFQMDVLNNTLAVGTATVSAKMTLPDGAVVDLPMGGPGIDSITYSIPPGDFSYSSPVDPDGMTFTFPLDQAPFPQPIQEGIYHMEVYVHSGAALIFFDEDIDFWVTDRTGKAFRDISGQHDLGKIMLHGSGSIGCGMAAFDYNNDGLTDLFLTDPVGDRMRFEGTGIEIDYPGAGNILMQNNGDGSFTDVTATAGVGGDPGVRSYGAAWGDVDDDGDNDLVVVHRKARFTIFRNNGDGTFSSTPQGPIPQEETVWGIIPRLADVDDDGDLDLFFGTYVQVWNYNYQHTAFRNRLFLNQYAEGQFQPLDPTFPLFLDSGAAAGIENPLQTLAGFFFDHDRDGDLDLSSHQDFGAFADPNALFDNDGSGVFTEIAATNGFDVREFSMGAAAADFNGDTYLDVYSTSVGQNSLLFGSAGGTFTQGIVGSGAENGKILVGPTANGTNLNNNWGAMTFDLDYDMDVDLHITGSDLFSNYQFPIPTVVPDTMFENDGTGQFVDRALDLGLGTGSRGRVSVLLDVDNDGDLDIVTANDSEGVSVLRNDQVLTNHFVGVRPVTHRSAPGGFNTFFRVDVQPGVSPVQVHELMAESPHSGQQDNLRRFGMGSSTTAFETTAEWTSGGSSTWYNLAGDTDHLLFETVIEVNGEIDGSVAETTVPTVTLWGRPGDLAIGLLNDPGVPVPMPLPSGGSLDIWPNLSFLKIAFLGPDGSAPWGLPAIPAGFAGATFELQMVTLDLFTGTYDSKSGVSSLTVTL
ncbi:MAG: VCBS repeat-containing protein [Planctomycetota bacterium]|nr:VCBS repeat-containing protein [Planctomycetota bacterium]